MRVPIEWLKEFVEIEGLDQKELLDGMILSGSNLERALNPTRGVRGVILGKIVRIQKHPDADKLNICTILTEKAENAGAGEGEATLQIVTAATNVFEGAVIPVSVVGAVLAEGLKIKKGKLRGVESNGMLCSFSELGFESKYIPQEFADGILILDEEWECFLGEDALSALGMTEDTVEFEITPNRPDCLSMVGMAREVAATFRRPLKWKEIPAAEVFSEDAEHIDVRIETDRCSRYMAFAAKNVVIRRSPFSYLLRLMNGGVRPINNIVDITNYVLLEQGQPIHAFDRAKVKGRIVVRMAKDGEEVVTLDGVTRTLTAEDILIADEEKPIAVAGVMGLLNSAISEETTDVIFEIASFDKTSVRATSKRLGLRSEASSRFEKGISVLTPEIAAVRVHALLNALGAGTVCSALTDVHGANFEAAAKPVEIPWKEERIHRLIGVEVDVKAELERLGILTDGGKAVIPHYRLDLTMEADLAEEAARMYGYDRLPSTKLKHGESGKIEPMQALEMEISDLLVGMGINEIMTYSFVSPTRERAVLGEREQVRLLNPLGEEYSAMRTSLLPNMLDVVGRNHRRKNEHLAFFEIGRIYNVARNEEGLPSESEMLCVALYRKGDDFFTAKGIVEVMLEGSGVRDFSFEREDSISYLHPGRSAQIHVGGEPIGRMGELHPVLAQKEECKGLYVIEISLDRLLEKKPQGLRLYKPVSMFPAAERDAAFLVDESVTSGEIELAIRGAAKQLLEEVKLFDVYRDEKLGEGRKSMAYAMKFRADRTLGEEEVDKVFKKVIQAVVHTCSAQLRDS